MYETITAMSDYSNAAVLTTVLTVFGAQLLITFAVARKAAAWSKENALEVVRAELASDGSVFGKHRLDPLAHEPLRRQFMTDLHAEFANITAAIRQQNDDHRAEMRNLSMIFQPIVEQNGRAMEIMSEQMRRHGAADDDGNHSRVGRP